MANHALPITTSLYTDVLANLKDRIDDSLKMLDSVNTTPTNVPTNSVRFNSTTFLWEKYNGSSWVSLASIYNIVVSKAQNLVGSNSTTLLGSIPYQSNTDTTTLLAPNTTTTRKFLRQTGTGANGAAPVWDTLVVGDIPALNYISKITSVDNQLVRFNGVSGEVQGSGVVVDDNLNISKGIDSAIDGDIHIHKTGALNSNIKFTNLTTGSASTDGFFVGIGGDGKAFIIQRESLPLVFRTSNIDRLTIDSNGNLGLGVTPSAWNANSKVIEIGNSSAIENFSVTGADAIGITNNAYRNTSNAFIYKESDFASNYYQFDGQHVWQTAPSGTAGNAITWTTAMILDASQNLGVGKTPSYKVDVNGDVNITGNFRKNGTIFTGGATAWVNFNGTGTVEIRASFNVSSITDNGTGDYTVNFTNPMPDANYSAVSSGGDNVNDANSANTMVACKPYSSSNTRVLVYTPQIAFADRVVVSVSIFR